MASKPFVEMLDTLKLSTVVPLAAFFQLEEKAHLNKATEIGGKAFGLGKLLKYAKESEKILVPEFWVIACKHHKSSKDNMLALSVLPRLGKYSVRSGAPVSMPGMMTTELNVPFSGLVPAIHKVWDSYNSSHAVAYRNNNDIPHDIGTAVVIQKMAPPKYSGVCFTHDPNEPHKKGVFNASISYVMGTGDGLVGGTQNAVTMTSEHPDYAKLIKLFKEIAKVEGPSDLEFAVGFGGEIYLLQHRAIKFIDMDAASIVGSPEEADKVIVGGTSIGYPGKVALTVVDNLADAKEGTALYVKEFTPDTYEAMMKASGILCETGGIHCHAGIVSRSSNKPAISGIPKYEIESYVGKKIIIDGSTGCLYTIKQNVDVVSTIKEAVIEHLIPKEERIPRLTIRSRSGSAAIYGDRLAARFYYILNEPEIDKAKKDLLIKDIALACSSYGWMICLGESRHAGGKKNKDSKNTIGTDSLKVLTSLGVAVNDGLSRSSLINSIPQMDYENSVKAIKASYHTFNDLSWGGGYGGPPWAVIADVVHKYLIGELNEVLFLDRFFNLKHNNGTLFGKFNWFNFGNAMQGLLNIKQTGSSEEFMSYLDEKDLAKHAKADKLFLSTKDHETPVLTGDEIEKAKQNEFEEEEQEEDSYYEDEDEEEEQDEEEEDE